MRQGEEISPEISPGSEIVPGGEPIGFFLDEILFNMLSSIHGNQDLGVEKRQALSSGSNQASSE
jgi:hypothetical protein